MAIALNVKPQDYILEEDQKLEEALQTKFKIKPLSPQEYAEFTDNIDFSDGTPKNIGTQTMLVLEIGLVGWDNFLDASGNEEKYGKNQTVNISKLAVEHRMELSGAIMELSTLGEKVKN